MTSNASKAHRVEGLAAQLEQAVDALNRSYRRARLLADRADLTPDEAGMLQDAWNAIEQAEKRATVAAVTLRHLGWFYWLQSSHRETGD